MRWGANDGFGFDGPDLAQPAFVINPKVTATPVDQEPTIDGAPPANRIAVCYSYEFWLWPKRWTAPDITVFWPDPAVAAWRERVEQAYPPGPTWIFTNATMLTHPDGYHWDCIAYETGVSASDAQAYYQQWLPRDPHVRSPRPPYLVQARIQATDGTVTICPYDVPGADN